MSNTTSVPLKTCRIDCKSRSFLNIKTIFKSYSSRCLYLKFDIIFDGDIADGEKGSPMATVGGVFLFPECRLRVQQCWAALAVHGVTQRPPVGWVAPTARKCRWQQGWNN